MMIAGELDSSHAINAPALDRGCEIPTVRPRRNGRRKIENSPALGLSPLAKKPGAQIARTRCAWITRPGFDTNHDRSVPALDFRTVQPELGFKITLGKIKGPQASEIPIYGFG